MSQAAKQSFIYAGSYPANYPNYYILSLGRGTAVIFHTGRGGGRGSSNTTAEETVHVGHAGGGIAARAEPGAAGLQPPAETPLARCLLRLHLPDHPAVHHHHYAVLSVR